MNKKVAIITERIDITLGGAERSVIELAGELSRQGHQVDVLAAKGQARVKDIHILCQELPGRRACYFDFRKAVRKYLAANRYDIVHSVLPFDFADIYQPRGGTYAESILRNAASYQNKFIEYYKRITAFANAQRTMLLQAEKKICKDSEGPVIIAISEYVAEQFRRHYGVSAKRLVVVPNGVKVDRQIDKTESDRLRAQILAQSGMRKEDKPVMFLFAANNFRLKGLDVLIRAMQAVKGEAVLVVAGGDSPVRYRLLAEKLEVERKIVFLGEVRNIQPVLTAADVAVLPTFYDPASRFILEALAADKPVITTKFNGATDLFADNRHGRIIDRPENVSGLAAAISYFTNQTNIRSASEAIIADNLKEKVSISRVAKQLESVYDSIADRRKGQI